jgi:phosphohistidine phosphatase
MLAGAEIVRAGLKPDRILVSPAQRTRETYAALAAGFKVTPDYVEALYMATAKDIWDAVNASGGHVALVIGHNPGLHELASTLAERSGDKSSAAKAIRMHLPTAAFGVFELRDVQAPKFLAGWSPKD